MQLTNKPERSKIVWFNILTTIGGVLALPQIMEFGIKPELLLLGQGIVNVILRSFFNKAK